jgi:hypothetical protein
MEFCHTIIFTAASVALLAFFWATYLRALFFETLGIGRVVQPIDAFPYHCRVVQHPLTEGCEMMWLDDVDRVLYATCANVGAHTQWNPS